MPEDAQLANIYRVETAQPWQHYKLHRNEIYKKAQGREAKYINVMCCLYGVTTSTTSSLLASACRSTRIGAPHVACLVGLHLRLRPASNAFVYLDAGSDDTSVAARPR